jgi:hypothetical protein
MEINLKSNSGKLATIEEEYNCIIAHQRYGNYDKKTGLREMNRAGS